MGQRENNRDNGVAGRTAGSSFGSCATLLPVAAVVVAIGLAVVGGLGWEGIGWSETAPGLSVAKARDARRGDVLAMVRGGRWGDVAEHAKAYPIEPPLPELAGLLPIAVATRGVSSLFDKGGLAELCTGCECSQIERA